MSRNNKWTTSTNGEIFNGEEFDTKKEAIESMISEVGHGGHFWVGRIVELITGSFVDCESMIEDAVCQAEERVGEVAEDWLSNMTEEQKSELNQLIIKWLDDKGFKPTFYAIADSEEIIL